MIYLTFIWIKIAIYGLVVGRLVFGNLEPVPRLWAGIFSVSIIIQCVNFFHPINATVQAVSDIIIFGIALFQIKKIKQDFYEMFDLFGYDEKPTLNILLISLLFLISLFSSSARSTVTDVGFYYLQSIKWIQDCPVVPGLGNLFTRLANNSNWFITCAIFNPYWLKPAYGLNGFLFFTTIVFLLKLNINPIYDLPNKARIIFLCLAIIPMISLYQWHIESQNTDVVVTLLLWLTIGAFLVGETGILQRTETQYLVSFLALFIPTIKLNYLPITAISFYYLISAFKNRDYEKLFRIIVMGLAIYSVWCIRSVIVSGYIIFPIYQIDLFNFDWKMPKEILINENQLIKWWARVPNIDTSISSTMNFKEWFWLWILNQSIINKLLLIIATTGITLYIKDLLFKKSKEEIHLLFLFGISLIGIFICLFTAPDLRFCYGFIFLATAISFNEHLQKLFNYNFSCSVLKIALCAALIANGILVAKSMDTGILFPCHNYPKSKRVKEINGIKIYMAQSLKEAEATGGTDSLWSIWWGNSHRGIYEDRLWDADLPASPYLRKGLKLRGKTICDGFKIKPQ
ncbi:MAG: LIC_10190 family membrane protein [Verrucomicrobiia bacterium]|jgi:hypothetical protein